VFFTFQKRKHIQEFSDRMRPDSSSAATGPVVHPSGDVPERLDRSAVVPTDDARVEGGMWDRVAETGKSDQGKQGVLLPRYLRTPPEGGPPQAVSDSVGHPLTIVLNVRREACASPSKTGAAHAPHPSLPGVSFVLLRSTFEKSRGRRESDEEEESTTNGYRGRKAARQLRLSAVAAVRCVRRCASFGRRSSAVRSPRAR
jgi:hypothetical protein